MWQQNMFLEERQDSDQSISDDEDFIENWPKNLNHGGKNKQLERFSSKDDCETPVSRNEEAEYIQSSRKLLASISAEESIANEPQKEHFHNFKSEQLDGTSTWSTVRRETEELIHRKEKVGCLSSHHANSEAKRTLKGRKRKAKTKFSIHSRTHQEEPSVLIMTRNGKEKSSSAPQMPKGLGDRELKTTHSMTELLEVFQEEKGKQSGDYQVPSTLSPLSGRDTVQSVTEIMEGLQEKSGPPKETSKATARKGKRFLHAGKKNASTLGDRTFNKEDASELLDSSSSSENEAADFLLQATDEEKLKLALTEVKGQTAQDRLLEALDAAVENECQSTFKPFKQRIGYHGRLQQVMQTEKETHAYFLKQSQAGNSGSDEAKCIDVRILSRYLDAKLTVCECSFIENTENPQCMGNPEKLMDSGGRKICIFNSKTCSNVGLEIGTAIRVHPPWKEIEAMEGSGSIILCTYFSQIPMTSPVPL